MHKIVISAFFSVVLLGILAGCGGGGGSSSGNASSATNNAPTASFIVNPTSGNAPVTVTFDAAGSNDADGAIASYHWEFGDGDTGSGSGISHTFQTGGIFTVTLTVIDNEGASNILSKAISVTHRVSGTLRTARDMAFDSDTKDPNAAISDNGSIVNAQTVFAPVTVGGYANSDDGDTSDFFVIPELASGQTIGLSTTDSAANLDLVLYDQNNTVVAVSNNNAGVAESLTTSASGRFVVEVRAVSGASNYLLYIGQALTPAAVKGLNLNDDFVAGQVVVRYREGAVSANSRPGVTTVAAEFGLKAFAGVSGRPMLLGFDDQDSKQTALKKLSVRSASSTLRHPSAMDQKVQDKLDTLAIIDALRKRPNVLSADPNYIRKSMAVPVDPDYGKQWHYPLINLPEAWDTTTGNDSVTVAVVDSGVLLDHPDLSGRLVSGYDFISSDAKSLDGDGIDPNPDDPGNDPGASSFHGTHVAGIIGANSINGQGAAGVTWSGKIMPIRVLGRDGATSYDVLQGVRYAAGLANDSQTIPSQPAQVINLSLGGAGYSQTEQDTYTEIRNAGVIVVASAGNEDSASLTYPAAYQDVVSVSAVNKDKGLAWYSSFGSTIDLAAPGGDMSQDFRNGVYSTRGSDLFGDIVMTFGYYQGTSAATAHVAGVAALMKSINPAMTPEGFDVLLQGGSITQDLGDAGRDDKFGYGLIDAQKSVAAALSTAPYLVISPSSLNFETTRQEAELTVSSENGIVTITDVAANQTWLTVTQTQTNTYKVAVDRSGLTAGTHSATITFTSTANTVTVSVTMQVVDPDSIDNRLLGHQGYHYIHLIDPVTSTTRYEAAALSEEGQLDFSFDILPGNYRIATGTDANNDGEIGGPGEAQGRIPLVIIDGNRAGLDITTQFNTSVTTADQE